MGNVEALGKTLDELERMGRIEDVDAALVAAVRSMAAALDGKSAGNSQMYREYREALERLTSDGDNDGGISELLDELRAAPVQVRDPEEV